MNSASINTTTAQFCDCTDFPHNRMPSNVQNQSALAHWLERKMQEKPTAFPGNGSINYYKRFRDLEEYLNTKVHPDVGPGGIAAQIQALRERLNQGEGVDEIRDEIAKTASWLTDHGPNHIDTVISRASDLVMRGDASVLEPYEAYLLLAAAHFHDVGNVFGREGHEQRILDVMAEIPGVLLGDEGIERRLIHDIAKAHGGRVQNDKDTISYITSDRVTQPYGVRPHFLAAVLRMADELSDDHTRAAKLALKHDLILQESEVFHQYADRLRTVHVDTSTESIRLRFEIDEQLVQRKFGKGIDQVYLLNEIYNRTLKMHLERTYCMRYMRPQVELNTIEVLIEICTKNYFKVVRTIKYTLREQGYPGDPNEGIFGLCPQLRECTGEAIHAELTEGATR